jgi:hypothetical protein
MLSRYAWLARLADKARAEHAGTCADYVTYCPLSMGFLDRAGVGRDAFDALIVQDADDAKLVTYFDRHCSDEQRESANRYVLEDSRQHLDAQNAEEGRS